MKFYWWPKTRSIRIAWMLEETGVPYDRVAIDLSDETARANADFRATSPMGKVPAVWDGQTRLWDSGAICAYLADQYPAAGLAPALGAADRGAYLQWVMFTNAVIEPAMGEKFANMTPKPSSYGWGSFDKMVALLGDALKAGPWILGDRFCAADVLLGTSCIHLRQFNLVSDNPVLFEYADRCASRPAFQRAAQLESEFSVSKPK